MEEAFGTTVQDGLDAWTSYCQKIAQNRFLMGGGKNAMRVTFDWAIQPRNACKILEGAIDDRISPKKTAFAAREHAHFGKSDPLFCNAGGMLIEKSWPKYVQMRAQTICFLTSYDGSFCR